MSIDMQHIIFKRNGNKKFVEKEGENDDWKDFTKVKRILISAKS